MRVETYGNPKNKVVRVNGEFGLMGGHSPVPCARSVLIDVERARELRDALSAYLDRPPVRRWKVQRSPAGWEASELKDVGSDYLDGPVSTHERDSYFIWARTKGGAERRTRELHMMRRNKADAEEYDD